MRLSGWGRYALDSIVLKGESSSSFISLEPEIRLSRRSRWWTQVERSKGLYFVRCAYSGTIDC